MKWVHQVVVDAGYLHDLGAVLVGEVFVLTALVAASLFDLYSVHFGCNSLFFDK